LQTERVLANEAYIAWKKTQHHLFEQAPNGILVFDDTLHYLDANLAACQILRRCRDEVLGRQVGDFAEGGDSLARRIRNSMDTAIEEETLKFVLPDGSSRLAEYVTRPNVLPGIHLSFLRDVTDTRQLQLDMEHHSRLEAVGKVTGAVAHDFNNMLTAILSFTDLLLGQLHEEDSVRRYALGIQAAAIHAGETTQQLLSFCRRQKMNMAEFDVNEVVRAAADLVRRVIGENIRLVLELDADLPPVVADAGQLTHVLVNLAVNARDAMPRGGTLMFGTSQRSAGTACAEGAGEEAGTSVSIFVHDTGCGIQQDILPHIFDPFFTTKARGKGTGLGLATVYGIVKQAKGKILVSSEPGRGTTFEVVLPASSGQSEAKTGLLSPELPREHRPLQNLD
jgi:signal transduction histidine kinase